MPSKSAKPRSPKTLFLTPEEQQVQEAEEQLPSLPGVSVLAGILFELTQEAAIDEKVV